MGLTQPRNDSHDSWRQLRASNDVPDATACTRADVRDHHVIGNAPNWSRWSQAFRHLDGRPCDWRHAKPGWQPPRDLELRRARRQAQHRARLHRLGQWALGFFVHPDPVERRKIYTYLIVATWIVMCTIGMLAAHGVHP